MNGLLESRAAHIASLERELAAERERLQEAHKVSQERATAFAEKQAEWLDASMTAQVRFGANVFHCSQRLDR